MCQKLNKIQFSCNYCCWMAFYSAAVTSQQHMLHVSCKHSPQIRSVLSIRRFPLNAQYTHLNFMMYSIYSEAYITKQHTCRLCKAKLIPTHFICVLTFGGLVMSFARGGWYEKTERSLPFRKQKKETPKSNFGSRALALKTTECLMYESHTRERWWWDCITSLLFGRRLTVICLYENIIVFIKMYYIIKFCQYPGVACGIVADANVCVCVLVHLLFSKTEKNPNII